MKSSELKTLRCQSHGDINNMLATLLLFIIARLAITGSLLAANEKTQSICASPNLVSATKMISVLF